MAMYTCKNCLTSKDGPVWPECQKEKQSCPGELDERARNVISDLGGIYGPSIAVEKGFLVWCETGVFMFGKDTSVLWSSEILGLIDEVKIEKGIVSVSSGGGEYRYDVETGNNA